MLRVVPELLNLRVRLDERDLLLAASGQAQVVERHVVNGEHGGSRAEFGAHVADGGPVGQRYRANALTVKLNKLAHDALLTEHLGDGEHHVGRGHTGRNLTGELETNHLGDEH